MAPERELIRLEQDARKRVLEVIRQLGGSARTSEIVEHSSDCQNSHRTFPRFVVHRAMWSLVDQGDLEFTPQREMRIAS